MVASIKNILIGLFVFTAVAIIVFMLLFLHPSVGDNAKILRVRFTDIDKVNIGTRVSFAGKPVGEVISIEEIPEARVNRTSQHGDIYVYELILHIDSSVDVFNTDTISLRTSGLLGERNIEITPRPLQSGEKLEKVGDQVLYAAQIVSVEDTMKEIEELSKKIGTVLEDVHSFMKEIKKNEIITKISKSIDNINEITDALNQPKKWAKTLDNILNFSERARHSWDTIDASIQNIYHLTNRAQHSWATIDKTLNGFYEAGQNTIAFTEKVNQILDYTYQGKGTLGQLFMGDDAYLRLRSILHKGEVIMDDINSYGILFHLDKKWQRLQGRRLGLLQKLYNPAEFAKYFNQEMGDISSSLSRVSTVLNESASYPQSLIDNPQFIQRFAELLRRVKNMEETLNIYNEQIIAQDQ